MPGMDADTIPCFANSAVTMSEVLCMYRRAVRNSSRPRRASSRLSSRPRRLSSSEMSRVFFTSLSSRDMSCTCCVSASICASAAARRKCKPCSAHVR